MKKIILLSLLLILAVGLMAESSTIITVSGRIMFPVKNINTMYEPVAFGEVSIVAGSLGQDPNMPITHTDLDGYYTQEVSIVDSLFNPEIFITVICLTYDRSKTVQWSGGDMIINIP